MKRFVFLYLTCLFFAVFVIEATAWLSEHVLGVQVVEPGCKVIRVQPHLEDLQWVEGSFPTPYGAVEISHKKGADGKIETTVNAPEGIFVMK